MKCCKICKMFFLVLACLMFTSNIALAKSISGIDNRVCGETPDSWRYTTISSGPGMKDLLTVMLNADTSVSFYEAELPLAFEHFSLMTEHQRSVLLDHFLKSQIASLQESGYSLTVLRSNDCVDYLAFSLKW